MILFTSTVLRRLLKIKAVLLQMFAVTLALEDAALDAHAGLGCAAIAIVIWCVSFL